MNYIQIFQDSLRLFRTTKLAWFFGFTSGLATLIGLLFQFPHDNTILSCLNLFIVLAILFVSSIAEGSLIYFIYETSQNRTSTFSEAWHQSKSKIIRIIGIVFLTIPLLLIIPFFIKAVIATLPSSPLPWLFVLLEDTVFNSLITFGLCTIMIDDLKMWAATWTSVLITGNNFFRVFVIFGVKFFLRLLFTSLVLAILAFTPFRIGLLPLALDYSAYLKMVSMPVMVIAYSGFNLFFLPLTSIILTLGYLKFTKETAYPALAKRQNMAQESI